MTTAPTCIIAYTADDDRYKQVRLAGVEAARGAEARLILYDIDAAQMLAAPLPTVWSGEGARDEFPNRLAPEDLEAAGRHEVAEQVRDARARGVDAYAWLPSKKGADGLVEYADEQHADLILMPADMEEPGLMDRLRGAAVADVEQTTSRPVGVVNDRGEVDYR